MKYKKINSQLNVAMESQALGQNRQTETMLKNIIEELTHIHFDVFISKLDDVIEIQDYHRIIFNKQNVDPEKLRLQAQSQFILAISFIKQGKREHVEKLLTCAILIFEFLKDESSIAKVYAEFGAYFFTQTDITKSLEYINKAFELDEKLGNIQERRKHYIRLGVIYNAVSNFPLASEYLTKALELNVHENDKAGIAVTKGNLGKLYRDFEKYEEALVYTKEALAIELELQNLEGIARNTGNLGLIYQNLNQFSDALECYGKAVEICEQIGNKAWVGTWYGNFGNVYSSLNDNALSLEYFIKALEISTEVGDKEGIARHNGNIGAVYDQLGNTNLAIEFYSRALAIATESGNRKSVAFQSERIGAAYENRGDLTMALEYYQKGLSISETIGFSTGILQGLGALGGIYRKLKEYSQSLLFFTKALENREVKDRTYAITVANIGILYSEEEFDGYSLEKAEQLLTESIDILSKLDDKFFQAKSEDALATIYKKQERWKDYALHLEKWYHLEKELHQEATIKQAQNFEHRRKIEESERDRQVKLARFQEQEKILYNILPTQIAERMVLGEKTIADSHRHVSVFFSDIVGFTKLSARVTAEELVGILNSIFSQFDQLTRKHGLEKIKTIGDAYMAVAGAPLAQENHAERAALFALEVAELMKNYHTDTGEKIDIRIGLHTGSVVAGIIGENKFTYDLWGDAVNIASRMESHGEPGKIHVSEEFRNALISTATNALSIQFIPRGEMDIKGKGMMKTYFLEKAQ